MIANRPKAKIEMVVDGYSGFIMLDKNEKPKVALHIENECRWSLKKYAKLHPDEPLPHITAHVCRHTYCSNMAKLGMNPKTLQYLMGHSDISVTMNVLSLIHIYQAHHVTADTYQKIMKHFSPKLWLGMTATPDKRDDNVAGRNVYELFNYQIAYEIRLQQAMEENLLCPFHYFGITDLSIVGDDKDNRNFSMLTSDERVKHIIRQANYYGYSGEKVKGLIFCSSIKETQELSHKFNNIVNPDTGKRCV